MTTPRTPHIIIIAALLMVVTTLSAANHTRATAAHATMRSEAHAATFTRLAPHAMGHIDPRLKRGTWSSWWIGVPDENPREYGIRLFRKRINLTAADTKAARWVHISADERYKLYVNSTLVSEGPARGDLHNWKFETIDLQPYLREGDNAVCALVWFFGTERPVAQMTYGECGFLMQGDTKSDEIFNTNNSWRCTTCRAYSICRAGSVRGYYAAGPNERIDLSKMPRGWLLPDYDDSQWSQAYGQFRAAMKGEPNYSYRQLTERTIPQMEHRACPTLVVRQTEIGTRLTNYTMDSAKTWQPTTIAANTRARFILDQRQLTTGYLSLNISGGKGAVVTIGYAETLFKKLSNGNLAPIGNRDEVEDRTFVGYKDQILSDGMGDFCFTPLWWRTWRYIQIEVETKDQPLTLGDISAETSMYPFEKVSTFAAPEDPDLHKMEDIGWRTARLCANETYMDCPYYEQLQYFGDTRIQAMITMYNTHDSLMLRQALEMGQQSMLADGLTQSRYPSSVLQVISSYSLSWCGMVFDYWMYRDDPQEVKKLLPAVRRILAWYEQYIRDDGSMAYVPYWFFCDWASNFPMGSPIRQDDGYSAYQELVLLRALDEATAMEQALGIAGMAQHYAQLAAKIRAHFIERYWDSERRLFADTQDKRNYSQHTNIMAILCDILPQEQNAALCERILTDPTLTQATIYFRYFLFAALRKTALANKFCDEIGIFRKQLKDDMTTWAEMPEPTRSDCHAWGASPNIEFYRTILGIDSEAPGFSKIIIRPALGKLTHVSGTIPHPKGLITVELKLDKHGRLSKRITVPQGVECSFEWDGKRERIQ